MIGLRLIKCFLFSQSPCHYSRQQNLIVPSPQLSSSDMSPSSVTATSHAKTLRKSALILSDHDRTNAAGVMVERTERMSNRAKEGVPLTDDELNDIIHSLRNITPHDSTIDWDALRSLLRTTAHLSHKNWPVTETNSEKLAKILTPDGFTSSSTQMFRRILHEGNWDGALKHRKDGPHWAVLVTGVNGIRKTTAVYQPWFSKVLHEALVVPPGLDLEFSDDRLPSGDNSFFRQLDHIISTVCNEDFSLLYALTDAQLTGDDEKDRDPPRELIQKYSGLKASIFSRYRTLSELVGALLLKEAQTAKLNVMCETSGRDVAMFHYFDHFFGSGYNKLALHFQVNDLSCAKQSVDERMVKEIRNGRTALLSGDVVEVIYANLGGPYGSEVLAGVQKDSDLVWNDVVRRSVGQDWYLATMEIEAHPTAPWTIRAVRPDGSLGTKYAFAEPR